MCELLNVEALVFLLEQRMGYTFFNPYSFKIKNSYFHSEFFYIMPYINLFISETVIEYLLCALGKQIRRSPHSQGGHRQGDEIGKQAVV